MARIGRISLLDRSSGVGEIIDENEQEISFKVEEPETMVSTGSQVSFEIEMFEDRLRAVNIRLI